MADQLVKKCGYLEKCNHIADAKSDTYESFKQTFFKPMMKIISNLNNKDSLDTAVTEFAKLLDDNGETELAEYALAQIGIGSWIVETK